MANALAIKAILCHLQAYSMLKTEFMTDPLDKLPSILKQNIEKNLCTCNEVPKIDIINAIVNGATTVEEVKKQTYASMGTGCCIQQIERLIECLCAPEPRKRRKKKKNANQAD